MVRDTVSKILSSRVFYILFSLLVAIVLWMFVEIHENTVRIHTVRDVRVECLNRDILGDRGLLITSMSPETVNLAFECTSSVASKLTKDSLSVVIDLVNINSRGSQTIWHEVVYPAGVDAESARVVSRSVDRITLNIDRMIPKTVRVDVPYTGGAAEGYLIDQTEFSPREITVQGPANVVSRVDTARVNVLRENLTTTYTDDLGFTLLDENGDELDESLLSQLSFSDERIHVNIPVRVVKDVALTVDLAYGSGATSSNTIYEVDPPVIIIAGDPEDARDFNTLNLGTIDLTRFEYSDTFAFPIAVPNGLTNISGETEALVLVEVKGLVMKFLSVSNASIHYINEPNGYDVEIRTQSLDVRIRCRPEDADSITDANIRVVVDVKDLGQGTQRIPAMVRVDGIEGEAGAIGNYSVIVSIIKELVP